MKIVCISDLHGHLVDIPECDVCIIAGDASKLRGDSSWLLKELPQWVNSLTERCRVLFVQGNHDEFLMSIIKKNPNLFKWEILEDSGVEIDGISFWGTPWLSGDIKSYKYCIEEYQLKKHFNKIPYNIDVLITHAPMYRVGDFSETLQSFGKNPHLGSYALAERVCDVKPRIHICGHIHSGYGEYQFYDTKSFNVALVDERYKLVNQPTIINLDRRLD